MYQDKRLLSFIGARGGSKGLPGKNTKNFAGKPLIQWTVEASLQANYIDRTILSTDSAEIAECAKQAGLEVPFLRPDALATDTADIKDAALHSLSWLAENYQEEFDYIVLLQPTSPLRTAEHINEAIEFFFAHHQYDDDTLVSVYKTESKIAWLMQDADDLYINFCFSDPKKQFNRQDNPSFYLPNGAVFISSVELLNIYSFHSPHMLKYVMPKEASIDIDTLDEFQAAEKLYDELAALLKQRKSATGG